LNNFDIRKNFELSNEVQTILSADKFPALAFLPCATSFAFVIVTIVAGATL
jgi:hypothetical protein